ncbi:MAG: hypothetical protein RJQ07_06710 [Pseudomonadales bacterium]
MKNVNLMAKFDGLKTLGDRKAALMRSHQLDRIMRRLPDSEGQVERDLIADLYAHWGDPLSRADESYLRSCLAHIKVSKSHILQCGVGLSTMVMAVSNMRGAGDNHLWSLTDDPHWANVMRSWLTQYHIRNTHIVVCSPRIFDGYVWYNVDTRQLPKGITLALPSGGSASVGGAVGLIARMGDELSDNCVVLARDLKKEADRQQVADWAKCQRLNCVVVDKSSGFIKVTKAVKQNREFRAQAVHASLKLR